MVMQGVSTFRVDNAAWVARKARSYRSGAGGQGMSRVTQRVDVEACFWVIHMVMQGVSTFVVDNASLVARKARSYRSGGVVRE